MVSTLLIIDQFIALTCFSFVFGGLKNDHQEFHPAVSENGSGLMLVAASTSIPIILLYTSFDFRC
jgi:Ca2+:H+ antiporter